MSFNIIDNIECGDTMEMRMPRSTRHVIKSRKQLAAVTAAVRQEVVDVLAGMGSVSVAELAATLGRPASALYFHLRRLSQAGLVQHAGYRSRGGRQEALYRTVAPELMLEYNAHDPSNRQAVSGIVASMLRLGARDFTRSFERGDVIVSGAQRELWALRKTSRLSPAQVARVNRSIETLKAAMTNPGRRGRLYAITVMLTPLDRRRVSRHAARPTQSSRQRKKG